MAAVRTPTRREQLWPLHPGDAVLAGGTWLFSEPQPQIRRLVDVTGLGWPAVTADDAGLELAATCTVAEVARLSASLPQSRPDWAAAPLLEQCCTALLASFKVWSSATVGGNLCLALPAGSMIALAATLSGEVSVWRADGRDYRLPVSEFVTGAGRNALSPGEVVRAVHLPAAPLRARAAYRKLATAPLGRSAVVVTGRRDTDADGGRFVLAITAATVRPYVFEFGSYPGPDEVRAAHARIPTPAWTADPHGDPDWRAAMALLAAEQVRTELG